MSDFSSGAIVDDDLDFSAAQSCAKTCDAADAKEAAWGGRGLNIAIGVSALVMVAGIALWAMQLAGGMVQTGMRNLNSWGLYITSFMFFVGLSAGGLIISSVPKAFGIQGFGGISKVAVMSSIACTVTAIGLVVVDMGQPFRVWELFVYSNLGSPLMWDIIVLGTYLILSCVGAGAGRGWQGVARGAARDFGGGAGVRGARALRDRVDLRAAAGARDVAHRPSGPVVRVVRPGVRHGARDGGGHGAAPRGLP